ncbi:PucR family transcriptional regulator [Streptomyces sp. NPDC006602]|uniref:PucR family transcriptional regulator n=1 Tax=Streptomyces sp. NPDC006602 TaxID=3364751 RepID=UPI003697AEEC
MSDNEIQPIVDRLAQQLRRSVVIVDPAVRMLYSSAHFGDEDQVRVQAILHRDAGPKAIGHVLAQGVSAWTTAGVIPPYEEIGMKARVAVPVRWRGDLLGLLLVMDAEGSLTSSEFATISETAQIVAPMLAGQRLGDEGVVARERAVRDLVSKEPTVRRRALADLGPGDELNRFTHVTAIDVGVVPVAETVSASHVEMALRDAVTLSRPPGSTAELHAVTADGALLLLGGSASLADNVSRGHAQRIVERVQDMAAGRFTPVAGVGSAAEGLDRAVETADQARLARRAASSVLGTDVAVWADVGPYGPLLRIPADELTASALPVELRRLLDIDHGRQLTETLRAYLDNACSGPATSQVLNIHRTTLYYRLGRISELTGLDLADGRTRLVLHIGLTMMDLMNARVRQ